MSGGSPAAILNAVCEAEVPSPSVAAAATEGLGDGGVIAPEDLQGDLDRIVSMALDKDPRRRYASAQALGDDLRRHLERLPVAARSRVAAGGLALVRRHSRALTRSVVAGLALVTLGGSYFYSRSDGGLSSVSAGKVMLAALPLENLTGRGDQEYFVDGLHEEIVSRLGRLQPDRLGVIARTSTLQYRGTRKSVATIGRELGAHYILQGSVRQTGERVRVTAQLIQVSDQAHVWVETFERELRDLFSVQAEVGAHVADSLELEVLPQAVAAVERHAQLSPEVFEAYLRGRYYWQRRWLDYPTNLQRAVDYFERVVAATPAYAPAHAALGESYESLSIYGAPAERRALQERARAAISNALALDTRLASAHATLALIRFQDWDWAAAEVGLREALLHEPNYADAHQYLAQVLSYTGRHVEADREARVARELDPLSPSLHKLAFFVHMAGRRWDKARETVRTLSELAPGDSSHVYFTGLLMALRGDCEGARDALANQAFLPEGSGVTDEEYAAAYIIGRCAEPRERARYASGMERRPQHYAQTIAILYAGAGDRASALRWLEESFRRHESLLFFLAVDPTLEPLRGEPRFQSLLRKMALPPQ